LAAAGPLASIPGGYLLIMQFTSDHAVLSNVKGASVKITRDTCRDFVYFRQLLRDARRLDDNIGNTLNKIDTADPRKCSDLMEIMKKMHNERMDSLNFCMSVLENDVSLAADQSKTKILQKEVIFYFHFVHLISL